MLRERAQVTWVRDAETSAFEQWPDLKSFWLSGCVLLSVVCLSDFFSPLRPLWRARGSARHFFTVMFLAQTSYILASTFNTWFDFPYFMQQKWEREGLFWDQTLYLAWSSFSCRRQYCLGFSWCTRGTGRVICVQRRRSPAIAIALHQLFVLERL